MPRGLALETSGRVGSVALTEDGNVVAEEQFPHGLKHAAGLVPMIDRLCSARGWKPADVREIYVSAGPGSFTGLRVGITVAKTLAFATGASVIPVQTLDALACNAPPGWQNLVVALDAKRDQVYTATYSKTSGFPLQREFARLDSLGAAIARAPRPVHLLGEGIPFHRQHIPPNDPGVIVTEEELWRPRAAAVAEIGSIMARARLTADPMGLTPVYIRRPEAEEVFEARNARGGG
ncbi:MAG TPA: tRNA (adenosine(37)-N6)-threonylcarbamoyltransferase complex dimerization subunit type 1 TsaB [Tepidisphaeraceae bacterium]|nr:tRNA (adenosine(37)-N6)-threonylcarbamoyltransferase complex dimerization subunit type 1 TsaB [Tepidisphaeraceae bacterium]